MIGLSVSLCVKSICRGEVPLEKVEKIIAGTRCETAEDWESVIAYYRQCYWHRYPDLAEKNFRQLLAEGKIHQPRLDPSNGRSPHLATADKGVVYWVDSEDEIQWRPNRFF